jgi:hypothetical protein
MPEHSQPGSIWQRGPQPSPLLVLLSSHVSPAWKVPLPQTNVHALGWPAQL